MCDRNGAENHFLFNIIISIVIASLPVESYKYLVISPVYAFSHMKCMATIANQLASRGHDVVRSV